MNLDIALEELLPHPVEAVWSALTEAEAISDWLMATGDFLPQVGARFRLKRLSPDGWIHAEVLEFEPPRRMVWSWSVDDAGPSTTVTFELTPEGDSTRLALTHVGEIDPLVGNLFEQGWPGRIELLRTTLAQRHDGGDQ